jgi:hypothetical protein
MMSKGDSRTNGITERKSTNRSDREDQDIGHIFSSLMSAAAPSPPAEKASASTIGTGDKVYKPRQWQLTRR